MRMLKRSVALPHITIVDWDAKFVKWASKNIPENKGSLDDPRVRVLDMDVRDPRLIEEGKTYDVILLDLPDPDSPEMQELYTYVVKTLIPAVSKNHVTVKAHVGPAVLSNKKHPNWAFIQNFQWEMEDMFYKTGRRTEYRLEVDYIPSYMHEWGFALCVAWRDPTVNAGAYRQPSPSCCSDAGDDDECPDDLPPLAPRDRP